MRLTILIDKDEEKILNSRAKKNLLTLQEQVEDIIRRSCINAKNKKTTEDKCDDALVHVFSRKKKN
ncbi:MAG: hypothetical protein NT076_05650 [Candidatus Pacearchaeota archaeon]|nr:hypothetical protein [Candidatus Pacearchaeota archaeon]